MKGCVIPVVDDKLTLLALKNNEMNSYVSRVLLSPLLLHKGASMQTTSKQNVYQTSFQVKYKDKYEKAKGHYMTVHDTPQILHAKSVRNLASEVSRPSLFRKTCLSQRGTCNANIWIVSRANTRRPARRRCRVVPSLPCPRPVTPPTARRSRSSSAEYGRLGNVQQKHHGIFVMAAFLTFVFRVAESVQSEIRKGKGQVDIQRDDRSS